MPRLYVVATLAFLALVPLACGEPSLETRTFPLQYISPDRARGLIDPYVYGDRPDAPGTLSVTASTITVRETRDNLERIARVLAEYDVPSPWVRLNFQIIRADGATTADPRIADVETELRKLFRYEGYELVAEAVVSGTAQSHVEQAVGPMSGPPGVMIEPSYFIGVDIGEVRVIGDSGFVSLQVELGSVTGGRLATQINARTGQTLVLGNAQMGSDSGTTILTVRPELVEN